MSWTCAQCPAAWMPKYVSDETRGKALKSVPLEALRICELSLKLRYQGEECPETLAAQIEARDNLDTILTAVIDARQKAEVKP